MMKNTESVMDSVFFVFENQLDLIFFANSYFDALNYLRLSGNRIIYLYSFLLEQKRIKKLLAFYLLHSAKEKNFSSALIKTNRQGQNGMLSLSK